MKKVFAFIIFSLVSFNLLAAPQDPKVAKPNPDLVGFWKRPTPEDLRKAESTPSIDPDKYEIDYPSFYIIQPNFELKAHAIHLSDNQEHKTDIGYLEMINTETGILTKPFFLKLKLLSPYTLEVTSELDGKKETLVYVKQDSKEYLESFNTAKKEITDLRTLQEKVLTPIYGKKYLLRELSTEVKNIKTGEIQTLTETRVQLMKKMFKTSQLMQSFVFNSNTNIFINGKSKRKYYLTYNQNKTKLRFALEYDSGISYLPIGIIDVESNQIHISSELHQKDLRIKYRFSYQVTSP